MLWVFFLLGFIALHISAIDPVPIWGLGPFKRSLSNPILSATNTSTFSDPMVGSVIRWEGLRTINPGAVLGPDGVTHLLYRAVGMTSSTSRIGLAWDDPDSRSFLRFGQPVIFPANDTQKANEWTGGCEDPRVIEMPADAPDPPGVPPASERTSSSSSSSSSLGPVRADSGRRYLAYYTQWNRREIRLAAAFSRDLKVWVKLGPVCEPSAGTSGSVVTRVDPDTNRLVAAKIAGKYWMYVMRGFSIGVLSSVDLYDWQAVPGSSSLSPRPKLFDSYRVVPGPPAVLTENGVVLIYNGVNAVGSAADPSLGPGAISVGQALYKIDEPATLLDRAELPFLTPSRSNSYEFSQDGNGNGTVFAVGMVYDGSYTLYYGAGQAHVAAATFFPGPTNPSSTPSLAPNATPTSSAQAHRTAAERQQAQLRREIRIGVAVAGIAAVMAALTLYVVKRGKNAQRRSSTSSRRPTTVSAPLYPHQDAYRTLGEA
jgi:predicted GH43/DUF377 family glycosyl hydrolase